MVKQVKHLLKNGRQELMFLKKTVKLIIDSISMAY